MRTDSYFGSSMLESAYLYGHTNEKFGISPIPSHIKNDHLMLPYDPNTYFQSGLPENNTKIKSVNNKNPSKRFLEEKKENHLNRFAKTRITEQRIFELSAIPIVKLPNMYYASHQFIYRYLSKCQGTKYAVTAVHTPQEKSLFDLMLDDSNENSKYAYLKSANGIVNFGLMAAAWSKICSSTNFIYYKTPEHLCSYNNILEDRRKYRDTVAHNIVASRSIRLAAQSKRRYNTSTAAKKYRRLEPTINTLNRTITPSSDCLEQTTSTPINIAPRPPTLIDIPNEVHPSNIFGIGNNTTMQIIDVESNHASINSSNNVTELACSNSPIKKSIKRAPRKCQLCQNTSPTCKGSSKSLYCKFKCGICANSDCPARFENTKECLRK